MQSEYMLNRKKLQKERVAKDDLFTYFERELGDSQLTHGEKLYYSAAKMKHLSGSRFSTKDKIAVDRILKSHEFDWLGGLVDTRTP